MLGTIPGAEDVVVKHSFYWAYSLIRERDNTMLDSNKSYRRKNKVGKQDRKSQGWDGAVDVLCIGSQWRPHWEDDTSFVLFIVERNECVKKAKYKEENKNHSHLFCLEIYS